MLPPSTYKHFMALSTAARILSSATYMLHNEAANDLLKYVVKHFKTLYGISNMTYNVHGLLHLAKDSAKFGPLDGFSAFKFESYLGKLKRKVRSAYQPLLQICNRIGEMRLITPITPKTVSDNVVFTKPFTDTGNFLEAMYPGYKISSRKLGENCVYLNSGIAVKVTCFVGEGTFRGEEVINVREF